MSGKAAKIQITENQHDILQQIERSTTAPKRLVQRAGVILMGFAGTWIGSKTSRPLAAALAAVV